MTDDRELLTAKQYAARFGLHVKTVYSAIRYNRLPYPVARPLHGKRAPIRIAVPRESIQALPRTP